MDNLKTSERRLVAAGQIGSWASYDDAPDEAVKAAGLPLWTPPEDEPEIDQDEDPRDPDLHRKHEAEDQ